MAKPTRKKTPARPIIAFEPKGYDPKQIFQRISAEDLFEQIGLDPKYVPWMYISNVIQRVFARTLGQGPYGPVPIRCNADGSLFVAGLGGAYTQRTQDGKRPRRLRGSHRIFDNHGARRPFHIRQPDDLQAITRRRPLGLGIRAVYKQLLFLRLQHPPI